MPPSIALAAWAVLLFLLLIFDPAKDSRVSVALWVPLLWMLIVASRLPAQWLGGATVAQVQTLEEGNSLDRTVFLVLILLSIAILFMRSFKWGDFVARNLALVAFIAFCLLSVFWSDEPFVSFKRWYRDLGNYLVILVVLSDPRPLEAVRTVLRRLCYVLIPLSVVLIKYFSNWGRQYSIWDGTTQYVGAATSKNMLGVLCLVSGLFFFWDTVTRWSERRERSTKRIVLINFVWIGMTLWLLNLASSATARVCLVIGCIVIIAAHSEWAKRRPGSLKALIPVIFCLYVILAYGFDINGQLAGAVGRDPTLTDRTKIWSLVLSMHTNPLVGAGYESFWLGPRLQKVWQVFGPLNESHNGYLEVYLNLGLIGVTLLLGFLITSYRNICRQFESSSKLASLNLAFWTITLFYNMTEAAFKFQMMWVTFLLAAIAVPELVTDRVPNLAPFDKAASIKQLPRPRLEAASHRR